jgi:hypothetical protein
MSEMNWVFVYCVLCVMLYKCYILRIHCCLGDNVSPMKWSQKLGFAIFLSTPKAYTIPPRKSLHWKPQHRTITLQFEKWVDPNNYIYSTRSILTSLFMSLKNSNRVARKMHFIRKYLQFCGFFVGDLVINQNIYLHRRLEDFFGNRCHESCLPFLCRHGSPVFDLEVLFYSP